MGPSGDMRIVELPLQPLPPVLPHLLPVHLVLLLLRLVQVQVQVALLPLALQPAQLCTNMRTLKNIGKKDMEVPFNFNTYSFPKEKPVAVEDDVAAFIEERWPLSFNFSNKVEKDTPEVTKTKSRAYIRPEINKKIDSSMSIDSEEAKPTFGGADQTPADGSIDGDGVSWYGEGIEITGGKNVS
jgi:hypothetical protein